MDSEHTRDQLLLHLDSAIAPIHLKARSVPYALRPSTDKEINRLLEEGILEPVCFTEWATPSVPVNKPNGDLRLCGDYKCTLNRALKPEQYPEPSIPQLLSELSGGRYFAKLDLSQAYLQLMVNEESAKAQTIITHRGAFKCKRPVWILVAPGIYQRFIETLLGDVPGVFPYFDDVLIKGATEDELKDHPENLAAFL